MKFSKLLSVLLISTKLLALSNPNFYTIDKVLAVIYHNEGSTIVCQSDLRPGLDGMPRDLPQAILDRLMVLDAQKLKITISENDIDRHLAQVQKMYNLTRENLLKLFKKMGYTYQEGREQLRTMQMIDSIVDYRVRSKNLIEEKDVEAYYCEHPEIIPAEFKVAQIFIPFDKKQTKKQQEETIKLLIETNAIDPERWDPEITLKANEIASDKAFIKDLSVGSIVRLQETEEGVRLLRLIDKKPEYVIPLREREREIRATLSKDRLSGGLESYQKSLWANAHVRYTEVKNS